MRKRAQPAAASRVGTRVPEGIALYALPRAVAVEVPALARWAVFSMHGIYLKRAGQPCAGPQTLDFSLLQGHIMRRGVST